MPQHDAVEIDFNGGSRGAMALFDLQSWFGKRGAAPDMAGTGRDRGAGAREAVICSRDRKLETELKTVLVERGFSCSTARNGWACRYSVRRTAPELVIIDWRMGQNLSLIHI